jgi:cell fate (sporulation/competence/biofilm development) regulator YmcA (YheA/YmcA/DUF963 family)
LERVVINVAVSAEKKNSVDLSQKMKELLDLAQQAGVEQNVFFLSTLKRYQVQLKILTQLETEINNAGVLVTKQYVKGRENVYTHPAVTDYNRTSTAANQTVQTLLKIITTLAEHSISDSIQDDEEL